MSERIPIIEKITKANDEVAALNLSRLNEKSIFSINIMASPGAGKTSLIEKTLPMITSRFRLGVIEGDLATDLDAARTAAAGAVSVQITTGSCHMDAPMVKHGLDELPLDDLDVIIVENVGNLICPASWDLGTHKRVLIASVPEGDDKPFKYPGMYRGVDVLVINKIDLLPYVTFDMDRFRMGVEALNEGVVTFPLSCTTGEGLDAWVEWVAERTAEKQN